MTEFRYSKFRFIRIMQAIRLLIADKEDTKQVFIILEALGRRSGEDGRRGDGQDGVSDLRLQIR